MSIYYSKFYEAATAHDAYQDPNEVGNDLDAIEDAVVNGTNKVEDIADAQAGTINGVSTDPLEEAFNLLFECEYNDNLVLQSIGIHELNEAVKGATSFNEAGGIKNFFKNIKKRLVDIFERITKAFWSVVKKMDIGMKSDKKFIASNKSKIVDGYKTKDWSVENCYKIDPDLSFEITASDVVPMALRGLEDLLNGGNLKEESRKLASDGDSSVIESMKKMVVAEVLDGSGLADVAGGDDADISNVAKLLKEKVLGDPVKFTHGKDAGYTGEKVCDILSKDRQTYEIRKQYQKVKEDFKKTIQKLETLDKKYNDARYSADTNDDNRVIMYNFSVACNTLVPFEKNVMNVVFSSYMKFAKLIRAQARRLAHAYLSAYEKNKKDKKDPATSDATPKAESTTFSNIRFI